MSALLWKVKVDSYRRSLNTCRGTILSLVSVTNACLNSKLHVLSPSPKIFDKLPVICAKLSVHMTGDDAAEKDWRLFDIWDWRFDKLPAISAKLSLRVTGADASGKARCFSDF
ncbi:hypothetical protein ACFX1S_019803 [Malus domestica]